MAQQIFHFIAKHWYWVAALIIALLLLIYEESKTKGAGGSRLTPPMATRMINSENAVVLDIRETNAFAQGHIVGAVNVPLSDLERNVKQVEKYKQRPIILVCASGQKSTSVMNKLNKQGFAKVYTLAGGIGAWKTANMPLIKG
ncbi:rhodanese-like domain-containing protein [Candidiatus Paracoxiella cheracis]|uniref:rhodanese-like domain-containing protein n=1 Tax=Candidiatus Paracoxiella cheracis TaxID=3405120 RepID=UPI003BF61D5F